MEEDMGGCGKMYHCVLICIMKHLLLWQHVIYGIVKIAIQKEMKKHIN